MKMRIECSAKFYKQLLTDLKALNNMTTSNANTQPATSSSNSLKNSKQNQTGKKSKNKQNKENSSDLNEENATNESSAQSSSQPITGADSLVVENDEVNGTECEIILLIDPGLIKKVQETVLSVCKGQAVCDVVSLKETVEGDEIIT